MERPNKFGFFCYLALVGFLAFLGLVPAEVQWGSDGFCADPAQIQPAFCRRVCVTVSRPGIGETWRRRDIHELPGNIEPSSLARAGQSPGIILEPVPYLARPAANDRILRPIVKKYSRLYKLDEKLVWAVIRRESGGDPGAVSPKGAMGLMQLMPETADLMGVLDPFDVEQNIAGGVKYLQHCLRDFDQDLCLALAAYHAGPGNVRKYQGCPPFPETQNFILSVLQIYAGRPGVAPGELLRAGPPLISPKQIPGHMSFSAILEWERPVALNSPN
jgi:hypothetical protein